VQSPNSRTTSLDYKQKKRRRRDGMREEGREVKKSIHLEEESAQ